MAKPKLTAVDPTPTPTASEPTRSRRPEPPQFTIETPPNGPMLVCRSEKQPVGDWIAGAVTTCGIGNLDAVTTLISKTIEASTVQPPTTETINGVVALMHAIAPKDAVEAMLAAQMVATHQAAMECLRRAMTSEQAFQVRQANLSQASKLRLDTRGADLVVWWDKGYYPEEDAAVAELVAAFEQRSSKDIELVQYPYDELIPAIQAALDVGHAPDFAYGIKLSEAAPQWARDSPLVDLSTAIGSARDVRSGAIGSGSAHRCSNRR